MMIKNSTDRPFTILVVDDDKDTCDNLSDILQDLGYRVDVAHDGPQALNMVRSNSVYDVALLDLKMPGMDGLTLYRKIRALGSQTVVIIVTAHASTEMAEEALDAGAWKVLSKPVDFTKLHPLIDEAAQQPLVMIVDDDQAFCDALWDLLRERGYRVATARSVPEAHQHLAEMSEHSVVLIDMKLPGGTGRDVFHMVRDANPQARAILITGYRDELDQLVQQVVREGADAVCYKPFDIPRLLDVLQQLTPRE